MILGTGIDLAEVPRIRAAVERYGPRFIERVFTAQEIAYVERKANKYERYAALFAAKEAGMKAMPSHLNLSQSTASLKLLAGSAPTRCKNTSPI